MLFYAIQAFYHADKQIDIIVALPSQYMDTWRQLCSKYKFHLRYSLVEGGSNRFYSVKNALNSITGAGIVAIHDGVRPLISKSLILKSYSEAAKYGNAVPCIEVKDSVRILSENGNSAIKREILRGIQTPQCFDIQLIKSAYQQDFSDNFTDDATVLENTGARIHLFKGSRKNIKITWPEDLKIAAQLLSN